MADAQKLTVLQLIAIMTDLQAREVILELDGAPCRVQVTLMFPEKTTNGS